MSTSASGSRTSSSRPSRPRPRPSRNTVRVRYEPLGAARELFHRREGEVLLAGPAGTGKSRACLEKIHLATAKYPGARMLVVRKTLASLTATGLVTFRQKVVHRLDGVRFFGGNKQEPAQYRYPNGSVIVVGGMDNPTKVMSTEYDIIYVQEATELTEHDWETLTTRLRNGVLPYQQIIADCNPDAPTHWLRRRADAGKLVLLESRHEDNPLLWDRGAGAWTEFGATYIARLDALSGVRYLRLRLGIWAAAEGMVYEGWDRNLHLIERTQLPIAAGTKVDAAGIPVQWPRYWVVDFGYTNPFVWQAWAQDPDGRLYRYWEIYRTQRLVEDHARAIRAATKGEPLPAAVICDHDAEDRATLERHLGMATLAAQKAVSPGIQAVAARLRKAGDGRPRLYLLRDALVERDRALDEAKRPACTEEEIEGYVWDTGGGRKVGEQPVKRDDHGMDAMRYMVAHVDLVGTVQLAPSPW